MNRPWHSHINNVGDEVIEGPRLTREGGQGCFAKNFLKQGAGQYRGAGGVFMCPRQVGEPVKKSTRKVDISLQRVLMGCSTNPNQASGSEPA